MPALPGDRRINPGQLIIYNGVKKWRRNSCGRSFALSLAGTSAKGVGLIKVGETLTHRTAVARRATLAIILPTLLMTLTAAGAIAYGVGRGLAPVRRLQDRLVERAPAVRFKSCGAGRYTRRITTFSGRDQLVITPVIRSGRSAIALCRGRRHQLRTPIAGIRAQAEAASLQASLRTGKRPCIGLPRLRWAWAIWSRSC